MTWADVQAEMQQFKVAKTSFGDIRYVDLGAKDGAVILFSTGGGAGFNLAYAFQNLLEHGFRIIAVNRPGYYDLPLDAATNIEGHAAIYHAVLQMIGVDKPVHVFGLSMGGLSALYYAKNYPTQSLVLWSAVTGPYEVNQDAANSLLGKLVLSSSGKKLVSWLMLASAKYFPKTTLKTFLQTESNLDKKGIAQIANEVMEDRQQQASYKYFMQSMVPMDLLYEGMMAEVKEAENMAAVDWSSIQCPCLVVHSTADVDVSPEHPNRLAEQLPNVELKWVEAGGHFVWWGKEGNVVMAASIDFWKKWE